MGDEKERIERLLKGHFQFDPLYAAAVLKVSIELKGKEVPGLDELLEDTLSGSNLSQEDLRKYIEEHKSDLIATCERIGI